MDLALRPEEPAAGPWRVEPLALVVEELLRLATTTATAAGRAPVVAVDGRGGSGKSTLARRVQELVARSQVVHTDDIAWFHSRFGWVDLAVEGVLEPWRAGRSVHFQPPAWAPNGREGHIDVDGAGTLLVLEGVGASRRELAGLVDATVWVQSDWREAERRGLVRDGGTPEALEDWHSWQEEELPFLASDRPWERADVVLCGTPTTAHDPEREVVRAPAWSR